MTIHNALKYGTDLSRALARLTGLGEDEEGLMRLGETLTPTVTIFGETEYAGLRDELLGSSTRVQGLVAGEFAQIALLNQSTTRNIVVVDRITATSPGGAAQIDLDMATEAQILATLGATAAGEVRDRRRRDKTQAVTAAGTDPGTQTGVQIEISGTASVTTPAEFKSPPVILTPGVGVVVVLRLVAAALQVTFIFRERRAFPGEL